MQGLEEALADISSSGVPVLLVGESGTGKDFFASRLHRLSVGNLSGLIKLQCVSLRQNELAGFIDSHSGNGNGAHSVGTLVLDEVADLDLASQSVLLAALPEGASVVRFPDGRILHSRLICTTRHNLEERYRCGRFREELYFRISGVCLQIPPLRRRRNDIPSLLGSFLAKYSLELGKPQPAVPADLMPRVLSYDWPGNVRELENFARQTVLFGAALGFPDDSLLKVTRPENSQAISLKDASREASKRAERELILHTLAKTRWNRKRAAQELKISYKALLYKLKDISIDEQQGSEE